MLRRLARGHDGFGLIELLIAMSVMTIGVLAIVAGLSSGLIALNTASRTSTAGTVADKQMEAFRDASYSSIPTTAGSTLVSGTNSPDGNAYFVAWAPGSTFSGSTNVKGLTLKVYFGSAAVASKLLVTTSSTFSQCAQDMSSTACGGS